MSELGKANRSHCAAPISGSQAEQQRDSANRTSTKIFRFNGFTLLELLVVIVIIGLLTAVVGPRFFSQIGKSEQGTAHAQIDAFAKALDAYRLDTGRYPTTESGLRMLVNKPTEEPKWNGPYLQKNVPNDPWGRPYIYRAPGSQGDFDLLSYGKDGQPGGEQESSDISFR
jgi:general secretion pathway protein G